MEFDRVIEVGPEHLSSYRSVRLRALTDHPESFGETAAGFEAKSDRSITDRFEAQKQLGGFTLAAISKSGEIIGTVGLACNDYGKSRHRAMLWGMYVVPEACRQGIAELLVKELLARAERLANLEQIHLAVVTSNYVAIRLYTKMGFITYGTDPRVIKVGQEAYDEYLMVNRLRG